MFPFTPQAHVERIGDVAVNGMCVRDTELVDIPKRERDSRYLGVFD
jgi:hypothetical protein